MRVTPKDLQEVFDRVSAVVEEGYGIYSWNVESNTSHPFLLGEKPERVTFTVEFVRVR